MLKSVFTKIYFGQIGTSICGRTMSTKYLKDLNLEEKKNLLNSFDTVLTDCDGVLWLGPTPIPGSIDVMNTFRDKEKKTFYITNNSTQTRKEYVEKFKRLGFKTTEDEIICTAWLAAHYLKSKNFKEKVYVIGPKSVKKELENVGIESFGVGPDLLNPSKTKPSDWAEDCNNCHEVGAVVVAYDVHFSLPKIIKASTYLNNPDCLFIGTNTDERFPHKGEFVWPGTGVFVSAIETSSQRKAIIMGKPDTYIIDSILNDNGMDPKRTLMIGDRCNTDIYFGTRSGMTTLLVMTGVTDKKQLDDYIETNQNHLVPTYYTDSIADLLGLFN